MYWYNLHLFKVSIDGFDSCVDLETATWIRIQNTPIHKELCVCPFADNIKTWDGEWFCITGQLVYLTDRLWVAFKINLSCYNILHLKIVPQINRIIHAIKQRSSTHHVILTHTPVFKVFWQLSGWIQHIERRSIFPTSSARKQKLSKVELWSQGQRIGREQNKLPASLVQIWLPGQNWKFTNENSNDKHHFKCSCLISMQPRAIPCQEAGETVVKEKQSPTVRQCQPVWFRHLVQCSGWGFAVWCSNSEFPCT